MQFTVPQFIDQEDKIIGPITVRQFIILIVASILVAVMYLILRFWYFVAAAVIIYGLSGVLAFMKVNGRPFHFFLISIIERTKKPNKRVWNKDLSKDELKHYVKVKKEEPKVAPTRKKRLNTSQLSQLALIVDTSGTYGGEDVLDKPNEVKKS